MIQLANCSSACGLPSAQTGIWLCIPGPGDLVGGQAGQQTTPPTGVPGRPGLPWLLRIPLAFINSQEPPFSKEHQIITVSAWDEPTLRTDSTYVQTRLKDRVVTQEVSCMRSHMSFSGRQFRLGDNFISQITEVEAVLLQRAWQPWRSSLPLQAFCMGFLSP